MGFVSALGFIGENLGLFGLSPTVVAVLGLVVGEMTKAANTYFSAQSE